LYLVSIISWVFKRTLPLCVWFNPVSNSAQMAFDRTTQGEEIQKSTPKHGDGPGDILWVGIGEDKGRGEKVDPEASGNAG
jgi:hypothetical protein